MKQTSTKSSQYRVRLARTLTLSGLAVALVSGNAVADPIIVGDIGFFGSFTPATSTGASTTLATATAIDYNGNGALDTGSGLTLLATGDFATTYATVATLTDFNFSPSTFSPVNPLWSVGGFSFSLAAITIDTQNAQTLSLTGTGTISKLGFEDTAGTWNFTGQPAGSSFTFSAGSGPAPPPVSDPAGPPVGVPEPSSLALSGIGLLLVGFARKRSKR